MNKLSRQLVGQIMTFCDQVDHVRFGSLSKLLHEAASSESSWSRQSLIMQLLFGFNIRPIDWNRAEQMLSLNLPCLDKPQANESRAESQSVPAAPAPAKAKRYRWKTGSRSAINRLAQTYTREQERALIKDRSDYFYVELIGWPCYRALLGYLCMERCMWRAENGLEMHNKAIYLWRQCNAQDSRCKCWWSLAWLMRAQLKLRPSPQLDILFHLAFKPSFKSMLRAEMYTLVLHWSGANHQECLQRKAVPPRAVRLGFGPSIEEWVEYTRVGVQEDERFTWWRSTLNEAARAWPHNAFRAPHESEMDQSDHELVRQVKMEKDRRLSAAAAQGLLPAQYVHLNRVYKDTLGVLAAQGCATAQLDLAKLLLRDPKGMDFAKDYGPGSRYAELVSLLQACGDSGNAEAFLLLDVIKTTKQKLDEQRQQDLVHQQARSLLTAEQQEAADEQDRSRAMEAHWQKKQQQPQQQETAAPAEEKSRAWMRATHGSTPLWWTSLFPVALSVPAIAAAGSAVASTAPASAAFLASATHAEPIAPAVATAGGGSSSCERM